MLSTDIEKLREVVSFAFSKWFGTGVETHQFYDAFRVLIEN